MSDVTDKKRPESFGFLDCGCPVQRVKDGAYMDSDAAEAYMDALEQRLDQRFHQLADMATQAEVAEAERDALKARVEELKKERNDWRRKYFEMEAAQSRSIDQNGEHIKRIQRLERDKDEIRSQSQADLAQEKQRRGFRSRAYLDPQGIWRIGYGTKSTEGATCTETEAEQWLEEEMRGE